MRRQPERVGLDDIHSDRPFRLYPRIDPDRVPFDGEHMRCTLETMEHREMRTGPQFTLSAFVPPRCLSALELARQPVSVCQHISPETIQLGSPYQNPFRSSVVLPVTVAAGATLRVEVLDVLGRIHRVAFLGRANPGVLTLRWDGSRKDGTRCPLGRYYFRLRSEEGTQLRSVVLQLIFSHCLTAFTSLRIAIEMRSV
jgi:hypothetical protein